MLHKKGAQIRMAALLTENQERPAAARRPWAHPQTVGRRSFFLLLFLPRVSHLVFWWSLATGVGAGRHEALEKKRAQKKKTPLGERAKGCCRRRGCRARGFKRASTESRLAAPANGVVSRRSAVPSPSKRNVPSFFFENIVFLFFFFPFCRLASLGRGGESVEAKLVAHGGDGVGGPHDPDARQVKEYDLCASVRTLDVSHVSPREIVVTEAV